MKRIPMNHSIKPLHILLATDFSAHNEDALDVAIAMCKRQHGILTLFHAIETAFSIGVADPHHSPVISLPADTDTGVLQEMAAAIGNKHAITVRCEIGYGNISTAIASAAAALCCDLIVMGTKGINRKGRFYSGNPGLAVINASAIPVLTVPANAGTKAFTRILFPMRPTGGILDKYRFILPLIRRNHSSLVIKVLTTVREQYAVKFLSEKMRVLSRMLTKEGIHFEESREQCGNYASRVIQLAQQEAVDLVVINATLKFSWREFFSGSFTRQVIDHAPVPVLSFPAGA